MIDEQHRFGVAQRAMLRDKGDGQGAPHLLVMTATPIPRTLALTAYGDLDVTRARRAAARPQAGRDEACSPARAARRAAYKLLAERVAAGERAYVVCPQVEDDGEATSDCKDATTVADRARGARCRGARVGLVHGRLDGRARDRVMRAFKAASSTCWSRRR